jgi:transcriptional regulator with XRE-family HTH domain
MNHNKELLKRIKKDLQHGDIKDIAEKLKVSREYVSRILNSKMIRQTDSTNAIIHEAIRLIKDRELASQQLLEKLIA